MKRDPELLRLLLLEVEKRDEPFVTTDVEIGGYDSEQIAHHAALLHDAGFLVGQESSTTAGFRFFVERLTFSGHDFLETIRCRSIWRRTRDRMDREGVGFVLGVARDLALSLVRQQMGLQP